MEEILKNDTSPGKRKYNKGSKNKFSKKITSSEAEVAKTKKTRGED